MCVVLLMLSSCNLFPRKIHYRNRDYTIEDSEFGVAFISEFNGVDYSMYDTVYFEHQDAFFCKVWGAQERRSIWLYVKDGVAKEIDSTDVNFAACKKVNKKRLLD